MKKHLLVTVALLMVQQLFSCSCNLFAQAPDFLWAKQVGGVSLDAGTSIAVDASGNTYVTGSFAGSATFSSITLTAASAYEDMFIAKFDATGNVIWAKRGGGVGQDYGWGIAVDAFGNSYVTGTFGAIATFGSITLAASSSFDDLFIAKYDPSGNVLWAKKAGGSGPDKGNGIAVDASGNSYVTGTFSGNSTFGSITLNSSGYYEMFISKYDASGNVLWAKQGGGLGLDMGNGIAVDASGNSYVTGTFGDTATFGSITLNSSGYEDMFIAKYDALGNILWAKKSGGLNIDVGQGIAVDASGNSYVTGYFSGNATFGSTTLTGNGASDIFVVKYDVSGNLLWAMKSGGVGLDKGNGITLDAFGSIYVTGCYTGIATFGSTNLTASGKDIFIAKYDASGNIFWVKNSGGFGDINSYGIAVDAFGNSYITGEFEQIVTFGSTTLINNQNWPDMYVAKLSSTISGLDEEPSKAIIQVYPNPFNSTFSITLPAPTAEPLLIRLTDVLGREVYKQTLSTDAAGVVSVSPSKVLPAGLYQLQVQTAKASFTKKLVVE